MLYLHVEESLLGLTQSEQSLITSSRHIGNKIISAYSKTTLMIMGEDLLGLIYVLSLASFSG